MHSDRKWLWRWLGISLLFHIAAAIFSVGFQNSDEHFQILEFLGYGLGKSPAADLSIEFHRQMRPWLQIFLYWIPVRGLRLLGIENPFFWATVIRLVSALVGWSSLVFLAKRARQWISDSQGYRFAVVALSLTWFLPALHARHSSENLSGAMMTIAICLAVGSEAAHLLWAGFLAGLAFECRYQVGVMGLGLFFWLIFIGRARWRSCLQFVMGAGLAIFLGTFLDRIGYGNWVFAPWNYFKFNLLEGHLDAAGIYPFWDYFRRAWTESVPVLGFMTLAALIFAWFCFPRHPLTWAMGPFFIFHAWMGHKETRFLFPMMQVAPVALAQVLFVPPVRSWSWIRLREKRFFRIFARVILGLNLLVLAVLTFSPALSSVRFFAAIYHVARETRPAGLVLHIEDEDPFVFGGVPMNFYRPSNLTLVRGGKQESSPVGSASEVVEWWVLPKAQSSSEFNKRAKSCEVHTSTYPLWLEQLIGRTRFAQIRNWTLFRCKKE
jgi:phosphatidylinositol glycan class B